MSYWNKRRSFEDLKDKVLVSIKEQGDSLTFKTNCGRIYRMFHQQDCCENVYIDDIVGDLHDLVGEPILLAEEISNADEESKSEYPESYTWTFYKLSTIKGSVTIRWYGESNGYYSESVDFFDVTPEAEDTDEDD